MHNSFDPRLSVFAGKFSPQKFLVGMKGATSLYIPLPDTWEAYLQTQVSKNMRKKIKRYTKAVEALPGYRMEMLTSVNDAAFIETIMRMWYQKWQNYWTIDTFHIYHRILQILADEKLLWARLIYDGDTPVVGLVGILDRPHDIFFALLGSFNEKYDHLHAGKVLDAFSIRWAIGSI